MQLVLQCRVGGAAQMPARDIMQYEENVREDDGPRKMP